MNTDEIFSYTYFAWTLAGKTCKAVAAPEITAEIDMDKFAATVLEGVVKER